MFLPNHGTGKCHPPPPTVLLAMGLNRNMFSVAAWQRLGSCSIGSMMDVAHEFIANTVFCRSVWRTVTASYVFVNFNAILQCALAPPLNKPHYRRAGFGHVTLPVTTGEILQPTRHCALLSQLLPSGKRKRPSFIAFPTHCRPDVHQLTHRYIFTPTHTHTHTHTR